MADSIVVLYRGGRLPSWHQLSPDEQVAFQDEHVDLMLTVGARHGLQSIAGFRLLAPRGNWERWWTIRFPDLAGAAAEALAAGDADDANADIRFGQSR